MTFLLRDDVGALQKEETSGQATGRTVQLVPGRPEGEHGKLAGRRSSTLRLQASMWTRYCDGDIDCLTGGVDFTYLERGKTAAGPDARRWKVDVSQRS